MEQQPTEIPLKKNKGGRPFGSVSKAPKKMMKRVKWGTKRVKNPDGSLREVACVTPTKVPQEPIHSVYRYKGNDPRIKTKLSTPELRKKAYLALCDWIADGRSARSFVYKEEGVTVSGRTITRYLEKYEGEFNREFYECAHADGLNYWENLGEKIILGQLEGYDASTYRFFMRQKFNWASESAEVEGKESNQGHLKTLVGAFKAIALTSEVSTSQEPQIRELDAEETLE